MWCVRWRDARSRWAATSSPWPQSSSPRSTSTPRRAGTAPGRDPRRDRRQLGQRTPVARDQRVLLGSAHLRGQGVAQEVGDVAHPGELAGHRPVVEPGPPIVHEEVPDVVVAVDERALALVPQRPDVAVPVDVQLAELAELGRELVRELIDARTARSRRHRPCAPRARARCRGSARGFPTRAAPCPSTRRGASPARRRARRPRRARRRRPASRTGTRRPPDPPAPSRRSRRSRRTTSATPVGPGPGGRRRPRRTAAPRPPPSRSCGGTRAGRRRTAAA